jgi:hypothetical protein
MNIFFVSIFVAIIFQTPLTQCSRNQFFFLQINQMLLLKPYWKISLFKLATRRFHFQDLFQFLFRWVLKRFTEFKCHKMVWFLFL